MPIFSKIIPTHSVYSTLKISLLNSNLQATYAEENCHTLTVCISVLLLDINLRPCEFAKL